jgi:hypothetical protein
MAVRRRVALLLIFVWLPALLEAQQSLELDGPDRGALLAEDALDSLLGGPLRFAWPADLVFRPDAVEGWDRLPDGRHRWRLRVSAPGSLSLNFGFNRFRLPWSGSLSVAGSGGPERHYTAADNRDDGQLWTPVVLGDEALITLILPPGCRDQFQLELGRVGRGYRFFGEEDHDKTPGWCNINVVCPEGDPWRPEIRSVGVYSFGGNFVCTGSMINNTNQDGTPYFLTARHCGVDQGNAASVVVYWNHEGPVCESFQGGSLQDTQSGAAWRASFQATDMTLIELSTMPDENWEVTYAGWDRSGDIPGGGIAIHHPSGGVKCISFEFDPLQITSYLGSSSPGSGLYWRVVDWDVGTTEPGSSGSPLMDPTGRIIGQLHGGFAACGNDLSDWYGRLSMSWNGGGTPATQLSVWLDPLDTGALSLDLMDPLQYVPPLVLDDLLVSSSLYGAVFSWTTEQPVLSRVAYGLTRDLELGSVQGEAYGTVHELPLEELAPMSLYYFVIEVEYEDGRTAQTNIMDFRTDLLPDPSPVLFLPIRPNPSREPLTIRYGLVESGPIRLTVYDLRGRLVDVLVDKAAAAGVDSVVWDGTGAGSGVYFCRLEGLGRAVTTRLTRLR